MLIFRSIPALGAALFCLFVATSNASANTTPVGLWKTVHEDSQKERSLMRLSLNQGVLTGVIEKILDPDIPADARCQSCTGALHGKPLVGMAVLTGLGQSKSEPEVWEGGHILDPNNGKTFKVKLTLAAGGKELHVRGFVGSPLIGRTQIWVRAK